MTSRLKKRDRHEVRRRGKRIFRKALYGWMRRGTWEDNLNGYSKGDIHLSEYVPGSYKIFTKSLCGVLGRREWNPRKTTCHRCRVGGSYMQRLEKAIRAKLDFNQ